MIKCIMIHHSTMNYYTAILDHGVEDYLMNLERIHNKY